MIIKICGIKNESTLLCCEKNNVDFFGMIFYKSSPRNISKEKAQYLLELSKNMNIEGVGVFVDENINSLNRIIEDLALKTVQLHGEEQNDYINILKQNKIKVIKKISIKYEDDLKQIKKFDNADYLLFDYKPALNELPGGNSKSFDWNIIKNLKINKPWFLSGGINIKNIDYISSKIQPFGVDLSSGAEKELGIKDNHIINNLIDKLNYA